MANWWYDPVSKAASVTREEHLLDQRHVAALLAHQRQRGPRSNKYGGLAVAVTNS